MRSQRPRLHCTAYLGFVRCFLTFCTAQRRPLLADKGIVDSILLHLLQCARQYHVAVLAYCFMPDHVHLVVHGTHEWANIGEFVHQSQQRSAYDYARRTQQRLWQPSFYDRILRSDEDTWSVVRYVLENPVRAGLVDDPRRHAFTGSGICSHDQLMEAAFAASVRPWRR